MRRVIPIIITALIILSGCKLLLDEDQWETIVQLLPTLKPTSAPTPTHSKDRIYFPDSGLENAVRLAIGKPEGDILISDVDHITSFSAYSLGIKNLKGMEYFTALTELYIGGNSINDLSPLEKCPSLAILKLDGNPLQDLRPELYMDDYGRLLPSEIKFPSATGGRGFKPLADYIHTRGLKFGIHIMRGIPRQAVDAVDSPVLGTSYSATGYS